MKDLIVILASVVLSLGLSLVLITPNNITNNLGGSAGPLHTEKQEFLGGVVNSTNLATTSQGDVTLTAGELKQWANSSLVSFSPGLVAGAAITLPASSTLKDFVPRTGDRQSFCMVNSTSTAAVPVTFASGLGTNLKVASSSATALGSSKLLPGRLGCFEFVRTTASSTGYDIEALLTVYQ